MSKELVIGSNHHETKVAVLEEDQLVEVFFQRSNEYSLAGSIHKGRVTRVLPGMQSAFVDLGLERDTFLYVSDFFEENEDVEPLTDDRAPRPERRPSESRPEGRSSEARSPEARSAEGRPPEGRSPEGRSPEGRSDRAPRDSSSSRETRENTGTRELPVAKEYSRPILEAGSETVHFSPPSGEVPVSDDAAEPTSLDPEVGTLASPLDRSNPEADRNLRDRRGNNNNNSRRGRRNRGRGGRGIPENKYAQPSDSAPEPAVAAPRHPAVAPSGTSADSSLTSPAVTSVSTPPKSLYNESADVIILPGESLAKYRSAAPRPQVERQPAAVPQPLPPSLVGAPEASSAVLHATQAPDILTQREELALADAVLGHHDESLDQPSAPYEADLGDPTDMDDPPLRLDDVATSVSLNSPFVLDDLEREDLELDETELDLAEEGELDDQQTVEPALRPARLEVIETSREYDEPHASASEIYVLSATESSDLEASEIIDEIAPEESINPAEALLQGEVDYVDDDDEEELEGLAATIIAPVADDKPQTAEVRDTAPQALHRVSRRMRRRRGSSRFGGPKGDAPRTEGSRAESTRTESPAPEIAVISSASAPALQPDSQSARTDLIDEERNDRFAERPDRVLPSITDLLKAGQEIIVQIAKEPLGQKGARITSHIALPGRYVVFMPSVNHLGVSRKIASDEERQRLKRILQTHRVGTTGGFIVRTAGEGVSETEIAADMSFLYTLWLDIRSKAEKKPAPVLLHHDLDLVQRILRDQVTDEFKAIWVDNEELYESTLRFMQRFQPSLVNRVKMYTRSAPVFDAFGITQELEKALRPKVWLKSGGYIVINQTEALVAIDINTGKFVGKSNRLEDTIVKTNTEAVKEIVRQIRLRDLGGIIVVDFIDMDERKNRQKVMQTLEEAMRSDKAPYKILQFNDFGLVAITRKRVKQSLERTLCSPCTYCEGAGYVKSVQTIISEILVEAQKISRAIESKDVVLRVHPDVAKVLKANSNQYLEELESILGRPVLVAGDPTLHHEKFDLG